MASASSHHGQAPRLAGVEVVSWDLDGTLYDLERMKREVRRLALRRLARAQWLRTARAGALLLRHHLIMRRVRLAGGDFERPHPGLDALSQVMEEWYTPAIAAVGVPPGVLAALDAVAARGLRQVVVSDYRPLGKLAALGVADRFDGAWGGVDLDAIKPSRALFDAVVSDLGVAPSAVLHIGDKPDRDAAAAEAAGCRALALGRDFASFAELPELLRG